jgi:hypothetical protein
MIQPNTISILITEYNSPFKHFKERTHFPHCSPCLQKCNTREVRQSGTVSRRFQTAAHRDAVAMATRFAGVRRGESIPAPRASTSPGAPPSDASAPAAEHAANATRAPDPERPGPKGCGGPKIRTHTHFVWHRTGRQNLSYPSYIGARVPT